MDKKHDHNPKLILNVKEVEIAQTKSIPHRTFVLAFGEARTNAANPRLVRSHRVSTPENLQLDFEADDGHLPVITPVRAMFEIEGPHAYREVTVHAAGNSITRELPAPAGGRQLAGLAGAHQEEQRGVRQLDTLVVTDVVFEASTIETDRIAVQRNQSDTITFYGASGTTIVVQDSSGTSTTALFSDTNGYTIGTNGSIQKTVASHRIDTDYKVQIGTVDKTAVKGYVKVKGSWL